MNLTIKHFNDLTLTELYDILRLRSSVFIIEQACIYQDLDDADKNAYHLYLSDNEGIQAYLRVLPDSKWGEVSIGRVIAAKRRQGLGSKILSEGIKIAKEKYNAKRIAIGAQSYARSFYETAGFVKASEEYIEDGIAHIKMILEL